MLDDSSAKAVKAPKASPSLTKGLTAVIWPLLSFYIAGFVVSLVIIGSGALFGLNIGQLYRNSIAIQLGLNAFTAMVAAVIAIPPFYRYLFKNIPWREALGLTKRLRLKHVGLTLVGFFVYVFVLNHAIDIVSYLFPQFDADQAQAITQKQPHTQLEFIVAFVSLVVVPPIMEEILFRGYMFGALRRQYGFWLSAVVVSLVFGFVHGQWNVGIDVFILSMVSCYLREVTGALWASMLLHALKNGLAFMLLFVFKDLVG